MKLIQLAAFCVIVGLGSCKSKQEQTQDLVQTRLTELRKKFIEDRKTKCIEELMHKIELESDSILIVMAKRIKYDSLTIPYDSIRPDQPEITFPEYRKPEKPGLDTLFK
ncbi:MAG: hypothetical protein IPI45_10195 [Saprospiraceae bacterium]|nr:hypothetical protein [Saprospiraceae bacterium]MBK7738131.1 hypothetical protein [Saprospiraceae bacterium]MBK7913289.1 hypothetical protein [Saprospiraceae bacterium]